MGAYQLAGFWTANPWDNDGIGTHLDAEYSFEMGEREYLTWSQTGKGMFNKLQRGLGNTVGFIAEILRCMEEGSQE